MNNVILILVLLGATQAMAQTGSINDKRVEALIKKKKCSTVDNCYQAIQELEDMKRRVDQENREFGTYNLKTLDPDPKE